MALFLHLHALMGSNDNYCHKKEEEEAYIQFKTNAERFVHRYPPWNALKMQLLRAAYFFNYYQLLLLYLGWKKP